MADDIKPAAIETPAGSLAEEIDRQDREAEAALAAEEAAAAAAQQPPGAEAPEAQPAGQEQQAAEAPEAVPAQQPEQPQEQQPQRPTSVPYGRFAEVVEQRNRADQAYRQAIEDGTASQKQLALLQQQVAHLTGQIQGMQRSGPQPGAPGQPRQPDPLMQVEEQLLALEREYEAGGMSAVERERRRQPLARRHAAIVGELSAIAVQQRARQQDAQQQRPTGATGADLYLEDQTRQMEEANPWVRNIPEDVIADYKPLVVRWCQSRNIPLTADARGNRNLRAAFIALGKERGLDRIWGGTETAPDATAPAAQQPANAARLPTPPSQPPLLGHRGSAAPSTPGGITEAQFLAMTPEQRMALPDAVLEAIGQG